MTIILPLDIVATFKTETTIMLSLPEKQGNISATDMSFIDGAITIIIKFLFFQRFGIEQNRPY